MCQTFEEASGSISWYSYWKQQRTQMVQTVREFLFHVTQVVRVVEGRGLLRSPGSCHHQGLVSLWLPQFCPPLGDCFILRLAAQVVCHQFQGQVPLSTAFLSSDCRTNTFLGHRFSLGQSVWWGDASWDWPSLGCAPIPELVMVVGAGALRLNQNQVNPELGAGVETIPPSPYGLSTEGGLSAGESTWNPQCHSSLVEGTAVDGGLAI